MLKSDQIEQNQVEQAIRRSHCSNTGKEHACVGTCKITQAGIELECVLCGKDDNQNLNANEWLEERAAAVLHAAGMRYASLSDAARVAVLKEMGRDACPNCKQFLFHTKKYDDYRTCACGWLWTAHGGWKRPLTNPLISS